MAGTDTTEATAPEGDRLDKLEATQEQQGETLNEIKEMLAKVIPGSHKEAEQRTESRLDRASSVEEQVQAVLAKRDKDAADQAAADADKADRESTRQRLARLEETPPAPPRQRRTSLLGWGDGRDARR